MLFYKKEEKCLLGEKPKIEEVEVVSCEDCRNLLRKEDAQTIAVPFSVDRNYCREHKKPYTRVTCDLPIIGGIKFHYWALKEVDENGEVITKKK